MRAEVAAVARHGDPPSIAAALDAASARLRVAGIEGARRDARFLMAEAIDAGPETVMAWPERRLNAAEQGCFEAMIDRRARREPVSRILGRRGFWTFELTVTPEVLDPRPDSETVVRAVLERCPDRAAPLEILDLGTGSGCLLLALLSELPRARGLGVDISTAALQVARENAESLGLSRRARFRRGDWAAGINGAWQVIVSNPPYITESEIAGLAPEVARYDPRLALCAGPDGLVSYRAVAPYLSHLLTPDGIVALELGVGQADTVDAILREAGLEPVGRRRDLGGIERCLLATHPKLQCDRAKK
jgi:release factor glutamine methyltransferase